MSNLDEGRDWSCLPPEVLGLILSYLTPGANEFRVVCKGWNRAFYPMLHQSPWLVHYEDRDKSTLTFHHPLVNMGISYILSMPELHGAYFHCAKDGWLLMSKQYVNMFFCNPFSRTILPLPILPSYNGKFYGFTFTSAPTSEDCLVFGIAPQSFTSINIFTYCKAKGGWTNTTCNHDHMRPCYTNPIYHKGKLYCLDLNGGLGVFDPDTTNWTVFVLSEHNLFDTKYDEGHLLSYDDELAAVFIWNHYGEVVVKKWNESSLRWHDIPDIGEYMFFLSAKATLAKKSTRDYMKNKIYLPHCYDNFELHFCLKDLAFKTLGNSFHDEAGFPDCLDKTAKLLNCCWMEACPSS